MKTLEAQEKNIKFLRAENKLLKVELERIKGLYFEMATNTDVKILGTSQEEFFTVNSCKKSDSWEPKGIQNHIEDFINNA